MDRYSENTDPYRYPERLGKIFQESLNSDPKTFLIVDNFFLLSNRNSKNEQTHTICPTD
jgi:hypothetical protein